MKKNQKKVKNNQEDNSITRIYTYSEQVEEKQEYLKITEVLDEKLNVGNHQEKIMVIKQNNKYRAFLKLESITNHNYLLEQDLAVYNSELYVLLTSHNIKLRFINKYINVEDYDIGIDKINAQNETMQVFRDELIEEINHLPNIVEYYLEFSENSIEQLKEQLEYCVRNGNFFKYFNIKVPTEHETDYIYDELVLGDVSVVYNEDHIIYNNEDEEYKYYTKFLAIRDLQNKQNFHFLENITLAGGDIVLQVIPTQDEEAKKIINKSLNEMESIASKTSGKKIDQLKAQKEVEEIYGVINDLLNQDDNLIDIKLLIRFKGDDLEELENRIKTFKKDNSNFYFQEPIYDMVETEKYWLGMESKVIPTLTLTSKILVLGMGIAYNTFIQEKGFLMSSLNRSVVLIDRQTHRPSTGQAGFNEAFFGIMGSGKSTWQKTFILQDYLLNGQVICIDYADEYLNLCKELGGDVISVSRGSILNPFDIFIKDNQVEFKKIGAFMSMLYEQIRLNQATRTRLENLFAKYYDDIEEKTFKSYLNLFKSINDNPNNEENIDTEIIDLLENITINYPFFNGVSNVDLSNRFVVFDLKNEKDDEVLRPALAFIIINLLVRLMWENRFIYDRLSDKTEEEQLIEYAKKKRINVDKFLETRPQTDDIYSKEYKLWLADMKIYINKVNPKVRAMIDEAHNIINEIEIVELLLKIVKEGRKHNTGLTISTQTPQTMYRNTQTIELMQLIAYKYYLKQSDRSALNVVGEKGGNPIPESIIDYLINGCETGCGYLNLNEIYIPVGKPLSKKLDALFDGGVGERYETD